MTSVEDTLINKYADYAKEIKKSDTTIVKLNTLNEDIVKTIMDGFSDEASLQNFVNLNGFIVTLIQYPVIWLKIVLTYVFWITLNEVVITETIKDLFVTFNADDMNNLDSFNFAVQKVDQPQVDALKDEAKRSYNEYVARFANVKLDLIKVFLDGIIDSANQVLGNDVGTKARAACETAARGTTLYHYLKLMGCLSGLVDKTSVECAQIQQAVSNLINQVNNVALPLPQAAAGVSGGGRHSHYGMSSHVGSRRHRR